MRTACVTQCELVPLPGSIHPPAASMAAPETSRERSHKRERSRSRDRHSKRSRRSPVPESARDAKRSHRSRSRERHRSKREPSPDKSKTLDFAARQAARGDPEERASGKSDRDAQRSSKHSRSDSRDVRIARHSRERDDGDRHRRDSDRGHANGRARSRDRQTDSRKPDSDQAAILPGPPPANGDAKLEIKKAEPLSLEELLRKKQEEQAALAKVCQPTVLDSSFAALNSSNFACKGQGMMMACVCSPSFCPKRSARNWL